MASARLSVLDRLTDRSLHDRAPDDRAPDDHAPDDADAATTKGLRRRVSADELKTFIRRDLEWLLGTRRTLQRDTPPNGDLTVTEYGIPDFAPVSPADQQALQRIADTVRDTIEAFEPRLRDITVRVGPAPQTPSAVRVSVDAQLVVGDIREPVSFPFHVRTKGR